MKITPLEIRQKEFEKNFRGYDKDEVNAFLQTLSQEWERILEDNRDMRYKLDSTQREVEKLREVESSLFKTLKTAEDTGASMIDQANKTAELRIREANIKAEEILSEARIRGKSIIEKAEGKAQLMLEEMQEKVKTLRHTYKETEGGYEDLVFKLKNLATDILKKVERSEDKPHYDIDKKVEEAEHVLEEHYASLRRKENKQETETYEKSEEQEPAASSMNVTSPPEEEKELEQEVVHQNAEEGPKPNKNKSFFDEIE